MFRLFQNIADGIGIINGGIGVGHAYHRGESAPGRCFTAGEDILLIGQARVPQMDMHIPQTGSQHQTVCLQDGVRLGAGAVQFGDDAVFHIDIHHTIKVVCRGKYPGIANQDTAQNLPSCHFTMATQSSGPPSAWTSTISSLEVGRFLPMKSARMGSSR